MSEQNASLSTSPRTDGHRRLIDQKTGFAKQFLSEAASVIEKLDSDSIERAVQILARTRESGGRLFILGVGGSAGNASHATNDFRKIVGLETYAPTDNVSELTARTNDEGWATIFSEWLKVSRLKPERRRDGVLGWRRERRKERQPEPG